MGKLGSGRQGPFGWTLQGFEVAPEKSTPCSRAPTAVAVFATNAANFGHVSAVATYRQAALACDFLLLLGAHGGKTASALLLAAASSLSRRRTTRLRSVSSTPGLR
jgi:hypothetical protein